MRSPFAFVALLAVLAVLAVESHRAVGGPPEGVSGRMAFDAVGPGLDSYRKEKDPEKRLKMLEKLAPTRDARVAALLGRYLEGPDLDLERAEVALDLLGRYYVLGRSYASSSQPARDKVILWWQEHKADLWRPAQNLPR